MLIQHLQEKRNKLMTEASVILRSDAPTTEQMASANTMLEEATGLEQRIAQLQRVEQHEAEQREFTPAARPSAEQASATTEETRTRATAALRSFMQHSRVEREYRDILTTTTSGQAIIPQIFANELWAAMRDVVPVLDVVDTLVTNKNGAPHKYSLVNYTGTVLPVVPEGTAFPEIDPAFSNVVVGVDKLGGIVKVSFEELSDSAFDLAAWLRQQFLLIYGYSLETYVTNGDGGKIAGLVPTFNTGITSAATGAVAYPDIAKLYGGLTQAYARNAAFMMSTATRAFLMGLTATTGQGIFDPNPVAGPFASIFGRPVIINDSMPSVASGNTAVLFGDFKMGYLLRTDGAPEIKRLDERFADTDEVGFIIRTRIGGVSKAAGIAPIVGLSVK